MAKKVGIVGAGIAGLSAGCYLQMNGYDTEIFELHNIPGGLCTAWKREDYTMDGCIHWLVGSSPSDNFYRLWNELIDMEKMEFVDYDEYMRIEDGKGGVIVVYTDLDKLTAELLDKAPEDHDLIMEFMAATRKFLTMNLPVDKPRELYNLLDGLKMAVKFIPYMGALKKWSRISLADLAARCRNPLLKMTFMKAFVPEMAALFFMFTLVWMHRKSAGYPLGGSLNFARRIEEKYTNLGGRIHYGARVGKINTENNRATGLTLENGDSHHFDLVISAADGYSTIFSMLDGKFVDEKISHYYHNWKTFPSFLQVSLGVARTFDDAPHSLIFPLADPLVIDDQTRLEDLSVRIFNFDPSMAPPGKTVLTVLLPTPNYKYWQDLRHTDRDAYRNEKERIGAEVVNHLDNRFGDVKEKVEVIDVSTPATVIRYTNNWKGSFEGWILTPEAGLKQMKKTLPGLENFFMVGQWVEPGGGLPPALYSGRNIAQIICKKDGIPFKTD